MQIHQITFGTPEYDEAVHLRTVVLREPLGLVFTVEELAAEHAHIHLAAYNHQSELIGYLNLTPRSEAVVQMRQVAVAPAVQRTGIGKQLVLASEQIARDAGFKHMILHARDVAQPFYHAIGYDTVGTPFEEVTILHYAMEKML